MEMIVRATRWFLIVAPILAGVMLLVFGTAGAVSQAFGVTLIGIAAMVWMVNWFIRMTFDDDARDKETLAREERAREQRLALQPRPVAPAPHHPAHKLGRLGRRRRRPQ